MRAGIVGKIGFAITSAAFAVSSFAAGVTYAKDIRPILSNRCVSCHQPGQIAPMSLMTFSEVRPWAKSIAREVLRRAMPPFHAGGPSGRFVDDMRLTEGEIQDIVAWVKHGTPRGDVASLPPDTEPAPKQKSVREPDFFVEFPKHVIPAGDTSSDPYVYLYSNTVFEEDTWIAGYDWFFSDYRVVHHAAAQMIPEDEPTPPSGIASLPLSRTVGFPGFAAWFPGQDPIEFPKRTATLVKKGTRILATLHYSPTSEETVDSPRIGVYLYSGELRSPFRYLVLSVRNEGLRIPPGANDHRVRVEVPLKFDSILHSFYAHMHYRGKSARVWKIAPDGTEELLFDVPRYSFDWQRTYVLAKPVRVEAGTQFRAEFAWDNSEGNPDNPDPATEVTFGARSFDEMGGIRIGIETIPRANPKREWPIIARGKVISGETEEEWANSFPAESVAKALKNLSVEERQAAVAKALGQLSSKERAKLMASKLKLQEDQ